MFEISRKKTEILKSVKLYNYKILKLREKIKISAI